ncbi:MAG: hypothetical protein P4M11_14555 [Candidatus Pacebacteria bacterium]|nr:hypothetical protein [Candidatus Paceibacterota bacterium]
MKCIYSFQHCPSTLPNYTDYFYCILTQSAERVAALPQLKDSSTCTPLGIKDRIAIFKGCLSHVNFFKRLGSLAFPLVMVHSKKNCFVQLKHSQEIFEVILQSEYPVVAKRRRITGGGSGRNHQAGDAEEAGDHRRGPRLSGGTSQWQTKGRTTRRRQKS